MIQHSKPTIDASDLRMMRLPILSGAHASKKIVKEFENRLSAFIGTTGGVATNSGTSALHIALLSLGIKKGDEVIMPSFVCAAVLNAVNYVEATPVLADVDENSFNISYNAMSRKMTRRTKAVIIPYMFGFPLDIRPFLNLGPYIIEDCAQSLGARIGNKKVGSQGHVSIYSFYATKLISTGYGGMLISNSDRILKCARDLVDFDNREDYKTRFNYNMSDFQAALGISQLARLDKFIKTRIAIADYYNKRFDKLPVKLPAKAGNIYYRYVVRMGRDAAGFIASLERRGIEAKRPIFRPLHQYLGLPEADFPAAEKVFKESISLPVYPGLKESEKKKVADIFADIVERQIC